MATSGDQSDLQDLPLEGDDSVVQKMHQRGVVWTIWFTYGAFYFCRTNISAAAAALSMAPEAGGLGLDRYQVGWILAALKISYALGQLINGQLAERIRPRVLLAIGMFGSAALNVIFGLGTGFYFLLFVWACNGYCQSLGWTPCVRVVGNWIPPSWRGKAIGIIGTGYQITLGLTYVLASYSVEWFGWRGAVFIPAIVLAVAGIAMLLLLREMPEQELSAAGSQSLPAAAANSWMENMFLTLFNPTLWILGMALGLLNACRYGFMDWGLTHLLEVQESSIGKAGLKYCVIAIGAVAGSYLAGVATDRLFGGRRAPVIFVLLIMLSAMTLLYESVSRTSATGTVLLLIVIGFCIYGPQVLLVGTAPVDLAHKGTAAAAAGFVNFMGYMGAATGDVVTGYFSVEAHGGWQTAIYIWAGWALGAALMTTLLWNATSSKMRLLPAWLPRVLAAAGLLAGAGLLQLADGPTWLLVTSVIAALLLLTARGKLRPLAGLAGLLGLLGLICLLFKLGLELADDAPSWYRLAPTAAHGFSLLATVMVLIDRR